MISTTPDSPSSPSGIWPVLYAFFDSRNQLDREAHRTQTNATIAAGARSVVTLGLATEVNRLCSMRNIA
jgi:4-hydroxy-tetrahydrodipicolinate synthase